MYSQWYIQNYPQQYVYSVLHSDLSNGDSIDKVARFFHTASILTPWDKETVLEVWDSRGWNIEEEDEFRIFGLKLGEIDFRSGSFPYFRVKGGPGVFLQFRKGKLVNHHPEDYADPELLVRLNQNL